MSGFTISVIGGKGGVGKSLVAANLAFAFALEQKNKVLLLDFDKKAAGDQNIIVGMKSKKSIRELSDYTGVIDPKTITLFTAVHQQNVSYIGMMEEQASTLANINVDGLGKTLKAVKNIFPLTIIDAGSEINDLSLKALEYSTLILLIVTPDILAANQTKRMYEELVTQLYPRDMMQVVLNQYQQGHPVSPEVIGKQMGKPIIGVVPKDEMGCVRALNNSRPAVVFDRNSAFAKGVIDCARKIIQKNILKTLEKISGPSESQQSKMAPGSVAQETSKDDQSRWTNLKARIHKSLVEEMDLKKSSDDNDPKARLILKEQTKKMVIDLINKEDTKGILNGREDLNQIVKEILDEALGLGPLEDLLADKTVSEIMVNGPDSIYYERGGKIKKSTITFTNDRQVLNVIERIVAPIGRRIDEKTPYVDARLRDGSRVHAIIPPCAIDGCTITIRKFPENRLSYKDIINFGSLTQEMADFLKIAVEAKRNIVVSGGTGSGKTSLINILASFIPHNERIITCEDSAELDLPQEHVVRLETRPPTLEGDGAIDIRLLVKQTLRMRPDRIIVGECRGGEALDMLQAMGTGHDGSLTTVHSNSPRECVGRLETLVQYAGSGITPRGIKEMISNSVHIIIQQSRLDDGSRKVMFITELSGMQGDVVTMQDIFQYKQEGIDKKGKIVGKFVATGFIPKFIETFEKKGYQIPRGLFNNR